MQFILYTPLELFRGQR